MMIRCGKLQITHPYKSIDKNQSTIIRHRLPRLQIKLLTTTLPITPHSMPILIAPRTRLIKLAQTVLLRDPVAAVRTVVLDRDESVRADAVRPGVGALHRPLAVGDEVGFRAERADGGCGEGAGALGFGAAEGFVGLGGEGEGGEEGEEDGHGWELHGDGFCFWYGWRWSGGWIGVLCVF